MFLFLTPQRLNIPAQGVALGWYVSPFQGCLLKGRNPRQKIRSLTIQFKGLVVVDMGLVG